MKDHVFRINPDGTVVGLYTDAVPLHTLGALHVERASSVEFDNVQQAWAVTLADGTVLPDTFTTREDALACEVAHLHAELKGEPTAPREGLALGPIIENMRELHAIVASSALGTCRNGHALCLRAECHVSMMSMGEALARNRDDSAALEDRIAQQEFCEHSFTTIYGGRALCRKCGARG